MPVLSCVDLTNDTHHFLFPLLVYYRPIVP